MIDDDNPTFEITITGPFQGKSLDEVSDFITDSLHDWLNPNWKEGDPCECEFVAVARLVDDPEKEEC